MIPRNYPVANLFPECLAESFLAWCADTFGPRESDRFSSHAPFHFDLSILDLYVPLSTGASVVIIDEETGKTLWQFKTSSSINSTPITYTHNGRQYVTVLSGIGGAALANLPDDMRIGDVGPGHAHHVGLAFGQNRLRHRRVGDAAGVVAPASGEGIYYAMAAGRFAADAVGDVLETVHDTHQLGRVFRVHFFARFMARRHASPSPQRQETARRILAV